MDSNKLRTIYECRFLSPYFNTLVSDMAPRGLDRTQRSMKALSDAPDGDTNDFARSCSNIIFTFPPPPPSIDSFYDLTLQLVFCTPSDLRTRYSTKPIVYFAPRVARLLPSSEYFVYARRRVFSILSLALSSWSNMINEHVRSGPTAVRDPPKV